MVFPTRCTRTGPPAHTQPARRAPEWVQEVASSNLANALVLTAVSANGYLEVAESADSMLPEQSPGHS